jgi:hypothetical protein
VEVKVSPSVEKDTHLQPVESVPVSPTLRRQLILIADGNDNDRADLVMIAEGNVASNPVGAESVLVEYVPCSFLPNNSVLVDEKLFAEVDHGQLVSEKSGRKHSNACFYLACADGVGNKAIAFKRLLAPLATEYSMSASMFKAQTAFLVKPPSRTLKCSLLSHSW